MAKKPAPTSSDIDWIQSRQAGHRWSGPSRDRANIGQFISGDASWHHTTSPNAPVTTASIRGASIDTRRTAQLTVPERTGSNGCGRLIFPMRRHVLPTISSLSTSLAARSSAGIALRNYVKGKAVTATIDLRTASAVNENGKVEGSGAYFKNPQGGFGQYYRGPLLEMAMIVEHEQSAWPDVSLTNYAGRQIADVIDRQTAFKDLLEIASRGPSDRWRTFRGRLKGSSHVHRASESRGNDSEECIPGDRR